DACFGIKTTAGRSISKMEPEKIIQPRLTACKNWMKKTDPMIGYFLCPTNSSLQNLGQQVLAVTFHLLCQLKLAIFLRILLFRGYGDHGLVMVLSNQLTLTMASSLSTIYFYRN